MGNGITYARFAFWLVLGKETKPEMKRGRRCRNCKSDDIIISRSSQRLYYSVVSLKFPCMLHSPHVRCSTGRPAGSRATVAVPPVASSLAVWLWKTLFFSLSRHRPLDSPFPFKRTAALGTGRGFLPSGRVFLTLVTSRLHRASKKSNITALGTTSPTSDLASSQPVGFLVLHKSRKQRLESHLNGRLARKSRESREPPCLKTSRSRPPRRPGHPASPQTTTDSWPTATP